MTYLRSNLVALSTKYLLVGSIEACSGKSGTIIGLAHHLKKKGFSVAYGKPVGTYLEDGSTLDKEADVQFITDVLGLKLTQMRSPLLFLETTTVEKRLKGEDTKDYTQLLSHYYGDIEADVVILKFAGI